MPITNEFHAAVRLLEALRVGDRVRVTIHEKPPKVHEVTVAKAAWRERSYESTQVKVTYGIGRYSFNVTAMAMAPLRQGLVNDRMSVEVISRAVPAPRNAVRDVAERNASDGWRLDELDGRRVASRTPQAMCRDYDQPWVGYIWPADAADPSGDWVYEVRALTIRKALISDPNPVVLDKGAGKLREVLSYITDKS